jgi:large conductance mechanosensitive channel
MIQEFKKFAVKSKVIDLAAYGYSITVAMNFAILAFIIFLMIQQVAHLKNEALAALEPTTEDVLLL